MDLSTRIRSQVDPEFMEVIERDLVNCEIFLGGAWPATESDRQQCERNLTTMYLQLNRLLATACLELRYSLRQRNWRNAKPLTSVAHVAPWLQETKWFALHREAMQRPRGAELHRGDHGYAWEYLRPPDDDVRFENRGCVAQPVWVEVRDDYPSVERHPFFDSDDCEALFVANWEAALRAVETARDAICDLMAAEGASARVRAILARAVPMLDRLPYVTERACIEYGVDYSNGGESSAVMISVSDEAFRIEFPHVANSGWGSDSYDEAEWAMCIGGGGEMSLDLETVPARIEELLSLGGVVVATDARAEEECADADEDSTAAICKRTQQDER